MPYGVLPNQQMTRQNRRNKHCMTSGLQEGAYARYGPWFQEKIVYAMKKIPGGRHLDIAPLPARAPWEGRRGEPQVAPTPRNVLLSPVARARRQV